MKKFFCILIVFICIITTATASYSQSTSSLQKQEEKSAVTLYFPDGSTKQVPACDVENQLENGWYTYPVCTMYAYDGRTKVVALKRVQAEKAVGWYESIDEVRITMYAPDGRSKLVYKANIEAEQGVGWYTQPVCKMYAYDGREKVVKLSNVESELKVGWHLSRASAVFSTYPYQRIKVLNVFLNKNNNGSVEACICWRNDSGKTIDHITFEVTPFDNMGRIAQCSKTNACAKHLRVSQSIESFDLNKVKQGYIFHGGQLRYVTKTDDGYFFYSIYDSNNKATGKYTLTQQDQQQLIDNLHYWSAIWHNDSIESVKVNSIRIKYSDGTFEVIQNPIIWKDIYEDL